MLSETRQAEKDKYLPNILTQTTFVLKIKGEKCGEAFPGILNDATAENKRSVGLWVLLFQC